MGMPSRRNRRQRRLNMVHLRRAGRAPLMMVAKAMLRSTTLRRREELRIIRSAPAGRCGCERDNRDGAAGVKISLHLVGSPISMPLSVSPPAALPGACPLFRNGFRRPAPWGWPLTMMKLTVVSDDGSVARVQCEGEISQVRFQTDGNPLETLLGAGGYGRKVLLNLDRTEWI